MRRLLSLPFGLSAAMQTDSPKAKMVARFGAVSRGEGIFVSQVIASSRQMQLWRVSQLPWGVVYRNPANHENLASVHQAGYAQSTNLSKQEVQKETTCPDPNQLP